MSNGTQKKYTLRLSFPKSEPGGMAWAFFEDGNTLPGPPYRLEPGPLPLDSPSMNELYVEIDVLDDQYKGKDALLSLIMTPINTSDTEPFSVDYQWVGPTALANIPIASLHKGINKVKPKKKNGQPANGDAWGIPRKSNPGPDDYDYKLSVTLSVEIEPNVYQQFWFDPVVIIGPHR